MARAVALRRLPAGLAALLAASLAPLPPLPAAADQVRDAQWLVDHLDLTTAHQITRGEGVTVAVIDSGVDATHQDLQDNLLPGFDLVDPDNQDAWTPDEHGTLVAGVVAGHGHGPDRGDGVIGLAPGARLLPIRVSTGDDEQPVTRGIADAVRQAVAAGAGVISISLSSDRAEPDQRAIEAARRADVLVVAAAGNRPDVDQVGFPAALPTVVAVGGVAEDGTLADFSVTGPEIALTAPGDEIVTTGPGDEYLVASGTSLAAPVVAGTAALVRSAYPELTADQVIHRLTATATDAGPAGRDEQYGFGVVDPVAALTADLPAAPPVPDEPDQARQDQWHLAGLELAAGHELTRGAGVTVGLVGPGVDGTHPDLHRNLLPGADLVDPDQDNAWTPTASGTGLAGIIAGHGNRLTDREPGNRGVLGIAPEAELLPIRVTGPDLSDQQAGELAIDGIERAVAGGARVVCYVAARASQDLFAEAVAAAQAADVVLVAAAGDQPGPDRVWYPAANPAVLAVAAVDQAGQPAPDAVTGPEVGLTAPGVDLVTTEPEAGYGERSGSAVAAAVVAGAAALVRSAHPELSAGQVIHRLTATATDAGPAGRDEQYGHGMLDLVAALTADVPPPEPTTNAGPTGPGDGGGAQPPPGDGPDYGRLSTVVLLLAAVAAGAGLALLVALWIRDRRRRRRQPTTPPEPAPPPGPPETRDPPETRNPPETRDRPEVSS